MQVQSSVWFCLARTVMIIRYLMYFQADSTRKSSQPQSLLSGIDDDAGAAEGLFEVKSHPPWSELLGSVNVWFVGSCRVSPTISFKWQLLYYWANFNQTLQEWLLGDPLQI